MLSFLRTVVAVFVGLVIFVAVLVFGLLSLIPAPAKTAGLGEVSVLHVDLRQEITDQPVHDPFSFATGSAVPSLIELVETLARAEEDKRIKGAYVRVGEAPLSLAQAQEVRDALTSFKAAGKFVIAHTQGFFDPGLANYYVAAQADEIWMQPTGLMGTTGLAAQGLFLKGLLEKAGVSPDIEQYYEYKGAADMFTETGFTPPQRESLGRLLNSAYDVALQHIAAARTMAPVDLKARLDRAPLEAEEAEAAGLVDRLGYDHEAETAALDRAGIGAELVDWLAYYGSEGSPYAKGKTFAVIYGEGAIHEGESTGGGFGGGSPSMGGDTVSRAFIEASEDPDVGAIIFRVNSPGGSVIASDQIWNAVNHAREAGKPVVVTMGSVAASGGYYVSMSADRIIAQPSTITGSIGVVSGKMVVAGTFEKLGITTDDITVGGPSVLMYSANERFDQAERAALRKSMDRVYTDFTTKVAQGRDIPVADMDALARGRIWTGQDALERGLVDALGGFRSAVEAGREIAGLPVNAPIRLEVFPLPENPFEELARIFGVSGEAVRSLATLAAILDAPGVREARDAITERREAIELKSDVRPVR